jgi:hypothetical protein
VRTEKKVDVVEKLSRVQQAVEFIERKVNEMERSMELNLQLDKYMRTQGGGAETA